MVDVDTQLKESRIRELTLPEPLVSERGASVRSVVEKMRAGKRSCVLIVSDREVEGLFTERDILNRLSKGGVDWEAPIETVMTANPKTLTPDDRIATAIKMMTDQGYRHVPLVDDQGFEVGLLTAREVLQYIAEHYPAEVLNLPPKLHQTPRRAEGG